MNDVVRVIGIGMVVCFSCVILKKRNAEFAVLVSVAGGIALLSIAVFWLSDLENLLTQLTDQAALPTGAVAVLLKCLGLSYLAKMACDTCRDCGETSTATKIELAGKIGILMAALPLFEELLHVLSSFTY